MAKAKKPAVESSESKKKRNHYEVDAETFCVTWNQSTSAEEAAKKLGMPKDIALARASGYRSQGIHIKSLGRPGKKPVDVDRINQLLGQIEGRPAEEVDRAANPPAMTEQEKRELEAQLEEIRAIERSLSERLGK